MSAKVTKSSFSTAKEIAKVTTRDDAVPMKDAVGVVINYAGYVKSHIVNEIKGNEEFDSIVVVDKDGTLYATRSESFIKKMEELEELFQQMQNDGDEIMLKITTGKSRNGNNYISFALV